MNPAAPDFLATMAAASKLRDARSRAILSDAQQRSQLVCLPQATPLLVDAHGFDVIAEIKKRSPAEGLLARGSLTAAAQAAAYLPAAPAALSVLTEPQRFDGDLEDLHAVAEIAGKVPVMRKDFLVSRYQVREARLAGASGVLLIAPMLDSQQLESMLQAALELNMFVLVEIFGQRDLDTCLPLLQRCGPALEGQRCRLLLGVNCRDLRTLQVDFARFAQLAPHLPGEFPWVAESGLSHPEQAGELAQLGYRLALVGSSLMRSDDPAAMLASIRSAGAAACL